MEAVNARELALNVVRDVFPAPGGPARERGAQEALDYRARKMRAGPRERAFATELAYGAIKMRRALDWYLHPFVGERMQTLPSAVVEILRLGAYELIYTQADVHATVFEFVNLAKRYGHRGLANLVNAVLRGLLRDAPAAPERAQFADDDDYLATRYSLPNWLVRRWREAFGDEIEAICAAVNDPARAAVVVNESKIARVQAADELRDAGIATVPSQVVADCLLIESGGGLLPGLERTAAGRWWIQSESSAMAVDVLNPQPGETILDVCSGRGNKALQIGARLAGDGSLTCLERSPVKVAQLGRRLEEAGVSAAIVQGDATAGALPGERDFDRVLVDAPCSGIGVVGRHPEARWKKQAGDGERLAMTQRAVVEGAARSVREGGVLVYAVCSNDPAETTAVVRGFLERAPFERGLIPVGYEPFLNAGGDVAIPPGIAGRDGFFFARLERR
ncbi:MAG TPA: transcription antitermination factor NusB [Candidatus Tumulicola sp.]|jgi:16S rRNA (cytosine967-C5)-methyltransferase